MRPRRFPRLASRQPFRFTVARLQADRRLVSGITIWKGWRLTSINEWRGRVGQSWSDEWRRTDRSFSGLTDRLLGSVSASPIKKVLDVGCGAGEMSLAVARGHPQSEVVGIDVSELLVGVARQRGAHLRNAQFSIADAANWTGGQFAPDLVMSRHGVMFFDEPEAAFTNLARIAERDARLVFSCFRDRSENLWADRIAGLLPVTAKFEPDIGSDPFASGPFAFANQYRVRNILSGGGWTDIAFEAFDYAYVAGMGANAVEDATSFFLRIGPAAAAATKLNAAERAEFTERLRGYLENWRNADIVALPAAAWIVSARSART